MADTIQILVATDNHVGYNERDPVRGDDSWKTFDEIMELAKSRDVDMVLLGGDLFHENLPSRKSMYNVMRSLRTNCYGDKPCEVELISDGSEHFDPIIQHANYEDPDINVAIPVFSIHGNHDDPSGNGHYAALDLLDMAGLMNYFGRIPEGDNIHVRPVLLQKGSTKLALYGLSNVRDERMYRTFRDEKAHFYQPTDQQDDWFNIACVHQNHHAHTQTSYLPENFLPSFLDLVIWGHEHECDIEPHLNPEMGFRVMQPGSSVATSLMLGEAATKHVTILSVTGRDLKTEPIRLKTVRPFVYRDIVLSQDKEAVKIAQKNNHRHKLTEHLQRIVNSLIDEARTQWDEGQDQDGHADSSETAEFPLPLIRLRVETSPHDGNTKFELENPQRFSNRFIGKVANHNDVIQFHAKKRAAARRNGKIEEVDQDALDKLDFNKVQVSKLVQDFLAAQSLTILPQNRFGDAVTDYISKDDKHAMDHFVDDSLKQQVDHLVLMHDEDEDEAGDLVAQIDEYRGQLEDMFAKGELKKVARKARFKPKPDNWDSDLDGAWEEQPGALLRPDELNGDDDDMLDDEYGTPQPRTAAARGRGRGRGARGGTTAARGRGAAKTRATATKATGRSRSKKVVEEESEDEDDDIIMADSDGDEDIFEDAAENSDSQAMFFDDAKPKQTNGTSQRGSRAASTTSSTRGVAPATKRKATGPASSRKPPTRAAAAKPKQSTLKFSTSQASVLGSGTVGNRSQSIEIEDDDDDDDDAFEPVASTRSTRRR